MNMCSGFRAEKIDGTALVTLQLIPNPKSAVDIKNLSDSTYPKPWESWCCGIPRSCRILDPTICGRIAFLACPWGFHAWVQKWRPGSRLITVMLCAPASWPPKPCN